MMTLRIGGLVPEFLSEAALRHLTRLGIDAAEFPTWLSSLESDDFRSISVISPDSVRLFLHYVAFIEELPYVRGRDSRFLHLPTVWGGLWLPVRFQDATTVELESENKSFVIGSCHGLLEDLAQIQKLSTFNLGDKPAGYQEMFSDPERSGPDEPYGDYLTVQWIWRALYDAADMAATEQMSVWAYD